MKKRLVRLGAILLLAAPLGACALANVASEPAPQLFMLTPAPAAEVAGKAVSEQLLVDEFSAAAAIDTTRIVFQANPNEVKYYADARWTDRAPRMIQTLAVATLENSGRFKAVSPRGAGLQGDYVLMGDIRQFAAVAGVGGADTVSVDLFVRLVGKDDHSIIASRNIAASAPISGSGMPAVVAAYDAALHQALAQISVWTIAETTTRVADGKN